jgi:hypothetical protein
MACDDGVQVDLQLPDVEDIMPTTATIFGNTTSAFVPDVDAGRRRRKPVALR